MHRFTALRQVFGCMNAKSTASPGKNPIIWFHRQRSWVSRFPSPPHHHESLKYNLGHISKPNFPKYFNQVSDKSGSDFWCVFFPGFQKERKKVITHLNSNYTPRRDPCYTVRFILHFYIKMTLVVADLTSDSFSYVQRFFWAFRILAAISRCPSITSSHSFFNYSKSFNH